MAIKLDEYYRIEPDGFNFTLIKEQEGEINPKTGKPIISRGQWYPPTLKDALNSYMREKLRDGATEENLDLKDVLEKLKEIEDVIRKVC